MKILTADFDGQSIRRVFDEATETWWLSVIDVVQVLTQQTDDLTARENWNQLKRRLDKEGSQQVTNCHLLKMPAADGKQRLTDVAPAKTLLRLVEFGPNPKPNSSPLRRQKYPPARLPRRLLPTAWQTTPQPLKQAAALPSRRENNWRAKPATRWCQDKTTWRPKRQRYSRH